MSVLSWLNNFSRREEDNSSVYYIIAKILSCFYTSFYCRRPLGLRFMVSSIAECSVISSSSILSARYKFRCTASKLELCVSSLLSPLLTTSVSSTFRAVFLAFAPLRLSTFFAETAYRLCSYYSLYPFFLCSLVLLFGSSSLS